jgi:L-lactate dehydrogenase (cytochrome)
MMKAASIQDFRELARQRLPHFLFEYIDGGSYAEQTLTKNIEDLARIALRQRVLKDVSTLDLTTRWFGQEMAMPVALAPIGLGGLTARRGEVQAARAAQDVGVPFILSTVSACSMEEVRAGVQFPFWFQLYMIRDRVFMGDLLQRAKACGCSALVFTVDLPVPGSRYRDIRSGLAGASGLTGDLRRLGQALLKPGWAWDVGLWGQPHSLGNLGSVLGKSSGLNDFFAWMRGNFDASTSWSDLEWVRDRWGGPVIIKGILDPDDAVQAADLGVDAIVVSNHGGRQLDGVLSTAAALPAIVEAVQGQTRVWVDGGIRSGLDVVRMLALGAEGVLLGRAWAFALAASGQQGVAQMLQLLEAEMRVAMALTGATSLSQITRSTLVSP